MFMYSKGVALLELPPYIVYEMGTDTHNPGGYAPTLVTRFCFESNEHWNTFTAPRFATINDIKKKTEQCHTYMSGGRIIIVLEGFWKGSLKREHPKLERMGIITNWARELLVLAPCPPHPHAPDPQRWVHRTSTQVSLIVLTEWRFLWSYFKVKKKFFFKILLRFING